MVAGKEKYQRCILPIQSDIFVWMKAVFFKILSIFWVVVLFNTYLNAQKIPADSIYEIIKTQSVHADKLNWKKTDKLFYQLLSEAKMNQDSIIALVRVFEEMNDVHSSITYNNHTYNYYYPATVVETAQVMPLLKRTQNEDGIIRIAVLNEKTGYIQIPGISAFGANSDSYTQKIKDSICVLKNKGISSCIIDLRLNSGGNMYPMLGGLSCFFEEGKIASTVNGKGEVLFDLNIKNDNFYFSNPAGENWQMTYAKDTCETKFNKMPVVVLLSYITASSGQVTAIAFKQRPNTFFIGENTALGYATGNNYFYFSPQLSMNLSTAFNSDVKGNIYYENVLPDRYILSGDNFEDILQDEKVKNALLWLDKE